MNPFSTPPRLKAAAAGLLLCAGTLLAACTSDQSHEYLAHSDRITRGAGDAVASNRAVHTIDPWSRPSHNTRIDMDGKRAGLAARRYQTNTGVKPKGLASEMTSAEVSEK
jgi:hypothetical protein